MVANTFEGEFGRPQRPYTILIVCYANQCRSPMAHGLLASRLRQNFGERASGLWTVESAGTDVDRATPMHPLAREVLTGMNIFERGGEATQVTEQLIEAADLILTADRSQRSAVVRISPASVRRAFTLRQFARLCAAGREVEPGVRISRGADLERLAALGRSRLQHVPPEEDEIPDPIGGEIVQFEQTARLIRGCIRQIFGEEKPGGFASSADVNRGR